MRWTSRNPSSIALKATTARAEVASGSSELAIHNAACTDAPLIMRAAASASMSGRTNPAAFSVVRLLISEAMQPSWLAH